MIRQCPCRTFSIVSAARVGFDINWRRARDISMDCLRQLSAVSTMAQSYRIFVLATQFREAPKSRAGTFALFDTLIVHDDNAIAMAFSEGLSCRALTPSVFRNGRRSDPISAQWQNSYSGSRYQQRVECPLDFLTPVRKGHWIFPADEPDCCRYFQRTLAKGSLSATDPAFILRYH